MVSWLLRLFDFRRSPTSIAKERARLIAERAEAVRRHERRAQLDRMLRDATTAQLRAEVGR